MGEEAPDGLVGVSSYDVGSGKLAEFGEEASRHVADVVKYIDGGKRALDAIFKRVAP